MSDKPDYLDDLRECQRVLDLVRRMRDAQRRYFKTRDQAVLIESKGLEREVDRALDGDG